MCGAHRARGSAGCTSGGAVLPGALTRYPLDGNALKLIHMQSAHMQSAHMQSAHMQSVYMQSVYMQSVYMMHAEIARCPVANFAGLRGTPISLDATALSPVVAARPSCTSMSRIFCVM